MATITSFDQLDPNGTYTYADYLTWRFTEWVELIKGRVFRMSPAPADPHQRVSVNLTGLLWTLFKSSACQVRHAPSDVRLLSSLHGAEQTYTVVQPDIFIVCDPSKLDYRGCNGAPDLVIEIVSPGTGGRDMGIKRDLYAEAGVPHYWLAFPKERMVVCYDLAGEKYTEQGTYSVDEGDPIPFPLLPDTLLDVHEIFEGVQ